MDALIIRCLGTPQRIKVRRMYPGGEAWERTGRVGRSTGPRPLYLLMRRSDSTGSSDVLDGNDVVVGWWDGRKYLPVTKENRNSFHAFPTTTPRRR